MSETGSTVLQSYVRERKIVATGHRAINSKGAGNIDQKTSLQFVQYFPISETVEVHIHVRTRHLSEIGARCYEQCPETILHMYII